MDLAKVVCIIRGSGCRGYVPIETLGPGDPKEKVRRFLDEVRTALGRAYWVRRTEIVP